MSAREEILARVRGALADRPTAAEAEPPRAYRRAGTRSAEEVVALFAERCADYRADVRRVAADALPEAIAAVLREHGATRVAIPADVPATWRAAGVEWIEDDGLEHAALDGADGVLTGCAAAIAETGTIALDGGPHQGRRALTLLPDLHVCVVEAQQIAELVPEAFERLADAARAGHPITLVSGPSATSDIELQRVEGVHGPRRLVVLVVG